MDEKLEPCPFCGARTAYTAPPAMGKGRWVVQCDDCRAEGPQSSDNSDAGEAQAIAAWNRRTPTTDAIAGLRAELTEARAECLEQARLLGMSAERELALRARLAEARAASSNRDQ